jgi:NADH-quinone oxidoreductase subunit J
MLTIAFWGFAGLTLLAALGLALSRKLIYASFLLFVVLFGVAALFVFAGAEFLAVSQVIVYVGGILILIIFGVMLTQRDLLNSPERSYRRLLPGLMVSGALGWLLWRSFGRLDPSLWAGSEAQPALTNTEQLGVQTLTRYLLPFELISLLLLIALIGAAYLARPLAKGEQQIVDEDHPLP